MRYLSGWLAALAKSRPVRAYQYVRRDGRRVHVPPHTDKREPGKLHKPKAGDREALTPLSRYLKVQAGITEDPAQTRFVLSDGTMVPRSSDSSGGEHALMISAALRGDNDASLAVTLAKNRLLRASFGFTSKGESRLFISAGCALTRSQFVTVMHMAGHADHVSIDAMIDGETESADVEINTPMMLENELRRLKLTPEYAEQSRTKLQLRKPPPTEQAKPTTSFSPAIIAAADKLKAAMQDENATPDDREKLYWDFFAKLHEDVPELQQAKDATDALQREKWELSFTPVEAEAWHKAYNYWNMLFSAMCKMLVGQEPPFNFGKPAPMAKSNLVEEDAARAKPPRKPIPAGRAFATGGSAHRKMHRLCAGDTAEVDHVEAGGRLPYDQYQFAGAGLVQYGKQGIRKLQSLRPVQTIETLEAAPMGKSLLEKAQCGEKLTKAEMAQLIAENAMHERDFELAKGVDGEFYKMRKIGGNTSSVYGPTGKPPSVKPESMKPKKPKKAIAFTGVEQQPFEPLYKAIFEKEEAPKMNLTDLPPFLSPAELVMIATDTDEEAPLEKSVPAAPEAPAPEEAVGESSPYLDVVELAVMQKAHIKAHERKLPSGKVVQVKEHERAPLYPYGLNYDPAQVEADLRRKNRPTPAKQSDVAPDWDKRGVDSTPRPPRQQVTTRQLSGSDADRVENLIGRELTSEELADPVGAAGAIWWKLDQHFRHEGGADNYALQDEIEAYIRDKAAAHAEDMAEAEGDDVAPDWDKPGAK